MTSRHKFFCFFSFSVSLAFTVILHAAGTEKELAPPLRWQMRTVAQWSAVLEASFSDSPPSEPDQWFAAYALGQYGAEAKSAVPLLIRRLEQELLEGDYYIRAAAARSLGMIGDGKAVPALAELLETELAKSPKEQYPAILRNAAWALGAFGKKIPPTNTKVIAALKNLLKSGHSANDAPARGAAAVALWKIAKDESALAAIREMLVSPKWSPKSMEIYQGALAAAEIGPELGKNASVMAEILAQRLLSKDQDVSRACAEALCALGKAAASPVKEAYEKQKDPAVRARLLAVLAAVDAKAEFPRFLKLAGDVREADAVRISAIRGMKTPPAEFRKEAKNVFVSVINDKTSSPGVVREAAAVLKEM